MSVASLWAYSWCRHFTFVNLAILQSTEDAHGHHRRFIVSFVTVTSDEPKWPLKKQNVRKNARHALKYQSYLL